MQEKEFDLLTQPWIKVSTVLLELKEVSLMDVMTNAHNYACLSGETPIQDAALLRILLAIAITVFYRYDEDGNEDEISEENDSDCDTVLERWKRYWEKGMFPESALKRYLNTYSERFWLFHPETPFWQVNGLKYGTEYGAESLVGNIKESNNKATKHHFSMTDGEYLEYLNYAEAARWVVNLNAYGVNIKTDKKAMGQNLPVGTGRLGQLGLVMVNGDNLFHILMLNLCPLKNGVDIWGRPKPVWEKEVNTQQGCEIAPPDNLPELYTIQSRRISLKRSDGYVTGFQAIGGDFYSTENDFNEVMTLWRKRKTNKKTEPDVYIPKLHDPSIRVWEEFPSLICMNNAGHIPGIVQWINKLKRAGTLALPMITFNMMGMVYGDQMKYTYGDYVNNSLSMSSDLITDLGSEWITGINDEVEKCQKVASTAIAHFASNISKLYGANSSGGLKSMLVKKYYNFIDVAFREWLMGIDPEQKEHEIKMIQWERKSYYYAEQVVEDYVKMQNINLYLHKEHEGKIISFPNAVNSYQKDLRSIYPKQ